MEGYCRSVQRRDYRREVALSHLTAETKTCLSHYSNTTNLVHWKYAWKKLQCYAQM